MFIRWIERPSKTPGYDATALSVILAETKRIDGKPRQRHIAYLGGITDEQIKCPDSRCYFWDSVTAAFDRLGNQVMPSDRQRFEAAIAERVPCPSSEEHKVVERERHEHEGRKKEALLMVAAYRASVGIRCRLCGEDSAGMIKGKTGALICEACIADAASKIAGRKG
jgi:hypothetical protein